MSTHKKEKVVSLHIFDPSRTIFKQVSNDKAYAEAIFCSNSESCELFAAGTCTMRGVFIDKCKYGRIEKHEGFTKRARKFHDWISEQKKKYDPNGDIGRLEVPIEKMAIVGDWIYLPYSHMNMNEIVPFESHSKFFVSGTKFILRSQFTLETIKKIVTFRPQAMVARREIKSYQEEEVPKFLSHLNEKFPDLYEEFFETYPELKEDYKPDKISYVGRKAYLLTLKSGFTYCINHEKYPVEWHWDGEYLKTKSKDAYSSTWGKIKDYDDLEVKVKPNDDTVIEVQSDDWINENTKFKD